MRQLALALGSLAGCVTPAVEVAREPEPTVCARQTIAAQGGTVEVATTPVGATLVVVPHGGGAVMTQRLDANASAVGELALAWPGTYQRATVATIGDHVIIGAIAGDVTWMLSAPLGLPPYRELAILGGVVGASPVVLAGGQRVTASVSYGGMQVNAFDATWAPKTSVQAVLTGDAREIASVATGDEALVVWSTATACNVARLYNAAAGDSWIDPGPCAAPRIAAGANDVGLVFERDGGVYFARAEASELRPASAMRIADGRLPRIIALGDRYWLSYLDPSGTVIAGFDDRGDAGGVPPRDRLVPVATADAHELAIVGGVPRVFATGPTGLTVASLCAE